MHRITWAMAAGFSMGRTCKETESGMGRSMMEEARQSSESSLPKRRSESAWHQAPSDV